jgi:hypothetical protein
MIMNIVIKSKLPFREHRSDVAYGKAKKLLNSGRKEACYQMQDFYLTIRKTDKQVTVTIHGK